MFRRFVFCLGMGLFFVAGPATADEACFVEYHREFVGKWVRTVVQRTGLNGLRFETRSEIVRAMALRFSIGTRTSRHK